MKLLMVLLTVLRLAGIAVLIVVAVVFLLLLAVMLCVIKYEAQGEYKDGIGNADGFVSWFFGLVRVDFGIKDNSFDYKLRLPFLSLINRQKKQSDKRRARASDTKPPLSDKKAEDGRSGRSKPKAEAVTEKSKRSDMPKIKKTKNKAQREKKNNPTAEKEKSLPEKLIYYYKHYELKKLYQPFKRFIKRFISAVGIKHAGADVIFGLDDPSATGMLLGGGAAAAAFLPFRLDLRGHFGGEYLEAKANIRGSTSVLALIIPCIRMVFEKPVWNTLMKLKG